MRSGGEQRLRQALDACLLNDEEFRLWEEAMDSGNAVIAKLEDLFEDGFEDWLDDHQDHDHEDGHGHPHPHVPIINDS